MQYFKAKIRLDYMSTKPTKGLLGGKTLEATAEDLRQHKVASLRNVPLQGITLEEIEINQEVYVVQDDITGKLKAYAPVSIIIWADSLEDMLPFVMLDEFRTIQILEPEEWSLSHVQMEKILFKINEELIEYRKNIERKIEHWK
jgi:hypothetical protein